VRRKKMNCKITKVSLAGKDVKILPLSTNFYVEPTARQNFNVVSSNLIIRNQAEARGC
jgi:hypothetical protein